MTYKKTLLTLCVFLSIFFSCKKESGSITQPTSDVDLTKGLLAWYPFNGNTNDASGNANNGIITGGGSLSYDQHGYSSSAFNCNGSPDRIVINNNGSIKFDTAFSVSLHVMIRSFGRQDFISLANNSSGKGVTFAVGTNMIGSNNLNFGVVNASVSCDEFNTSATTTDNTSSFELQPESWYNIICIFSNGVLTNYVNGKLISSKTSPDKTANVCPDAQLIIGGWIQQDPASLIGKIDEVRLYNRGLNADEIGELAKNFQ